LTNLILGSNTREGPIKNESKEILGFQIEVNIGKYHLHRGQNGVKVGSNRGGFGVNLEFKV